MDILQYGSCVQLFSPYADIPLRFYSTVVTWSGNS